MRKQMIKYLFLVLPIFGWGQIYTINSHPTIYNYFVDEGDKDVDSTINFKDIETGYSKNWDIYFSNDRRQIAFTNRFGGDSAVEKQYWRNGKLKQLRIRRKDPDGFYSAYIVKNYCKNGTLLEAFDADKVMIGIHTSYYCNGKKKSEVKYKNYMPIIETHWYDNGQKKVDYYFNKGGGQEGVYDIRDRNGKVIKKETWKNGKQIE